MTRSGPPSALPEQDYDAIEQAVMETARGRWFLSEFARRNRTADTEMLLEAISKLQSSIGEQSAENALTKMRRELLEMAEAIAETKREIASMRASDGEDGQIGEATLELDAIVESTEKATSEILFAAEQVQEIAWSAREAGTPDAVCDAIDTHVTEIYTACSFQDLTGQRTQKVVKVLRFIENRLHALVSIWNGESVGEPIQPKDMDTRPDAHLLNGPQLEGKGTSQDEVNELLQQEQMSNVCIEEIDFDDVVFAEDEAAEEAQSAPVEAAAAQDPQAEVSADADRTADEDLQPAASLAEEHAITSDIPAEPEAATEPDPEPQVAASPEPDADADEGDEYDLQSIETAAENPVELPATDRIPAYPQDGAPASQPIHDTATVDETHSEPVEATASDDGEVRVPSLHDLAFNIGKKVAKEVEQEKAEATLKAIAGELERSVSPQPTTQPVAVPKAGDDLDSLSTNQRIILFS